MNYLHPLSAERRLWTTVILVCVVVWASLTFISEAHARDYPDCSRCHKFDLTKEGVHSAVHMGCPACHSEPHTKEAKYEKGLMAEGSELCFACHDSSKFKQQNVHSPVAGGACTACHDPHISKNAKLLDSAIPDICFNCHADSEFKKKHPHAPVAGGMCMGCHDPHSSKTKNLLISDTICFMCHDRLGFEKQNQHPPVASGMCEGCHEVHSADAAKLLRIAEAPAW
jgi:predicted CXXCH cytochrome family protein